MTAFHISIAVFFSLATAWLVVTALATRAVSAATDGRTGTRRANKLLNAILALGIVTHVIAAFPGIAGLTSAFSALDEVDPSVRARTLSESIDTATSAGVALNLVGVAILAVSIIAMVRGKRRLSRRRDA